jgi:hypothetical protein
MQHDGAADDGARYTFGEFVLTTIQASTVSPTESS